MKRPYLLAAGIVALLASTACHRNDCATSTTNTTSAAVTPGEAGLQTARPAPNPNPSPAVPAATQPTITPADLPNAPSTAATGAANGSTATAAPTATAATATAPVDISGPTAAADANGSANAASSTNTGGAADNPATSNPAPGGNANATSTTAAPLVAPGLDNGVSGGVPNTGAPLNYGLGGAGYDSWFGGAPAGMPRPVGGAMRPGAASDPNTTSGAR